MSRKAVWVILAATAVVALAFYAYVTLNPARGLDYRISRAIEAEIGKNTPVVIDLAALASFDWESAFVFGPYATQDDVNAALGFNWQTQVVRDLSASDRDCLLVFVNNKRVAGCSRIARKTCDFSQIAGDSGRHFSRSDAVFEVEIEKSDSWRIARWKTR